MTKQQFFSSYFAAAQIASQQLGEKLDPYEILAYWHWETAGGTNRGAKELNNLGGIKYVGQDTKYGIDATKSGMYANYSSLSEFAKDYARVLNLSYYDRVLEAGETPGYEDNVKALNASPYAEADYDVNTVLGNIAEFLKMDSKPVTGTTASLPTVESVKTALSGSSDEQMQKYAVIGFIATLLFLALRD